MLYRVMQFLLCASVGFAQCPLQFLKVDPTVKEGWGRVGRSMASSDMGRTMPPDFVVKVKNATTKTIRGLKVQAAYFDATEDLHKIPVAWNSTTEIKALSEKSLSWPNDLYTDRAFVGWIVVPLKVLFDDGSTWEATSQNMTGCYGEYWRSKKRPRLTALPDTLLTP